MHRTYLTRKRRHYGGVLAEFGPVFMIFMLVLAFPIMDLLAIGLTWGCGFVLHFYSIREASMVENIVATNAIDTATMNTRVTRIEQDWQSHGLGIFSKVLSLTHVITPVPRNPSANPPQPDDYVTLQQTLQVNPFLMIPFPISVSGINAPMTFVYCTQRMVENPT